MTSQLFLPPSFLPSCLPSSFLSDPFKLFFNYLPPTSLLLSLPSSPSPLPTLLLTYISPSLPPQPFTHSLFSPSLLTSGSCTAPSRNCCLGPHTQRTPKPDLMKRRREGVVTSSRLSQQGWGDGEGNSNALSLKPYRYDHTIVLKAGYYGWLYSYQHKWESHHCRGVSFCPNYKYWI